MGVALARRHPLRHEPDRARMVGRGSVRGSKPTGGSDPSRRPGMDEGEAVTTKPARRFVRMFKPQFAPLVKAGIKRQTIRPTPKRMPQNGDIIDCREWTGVPYRSPQRRIGEYTIREVGAVLISHQLIQLNFPDVQFGMFSDGGWKDQFARLDGFNLWADMRDWFQREHGLPFKGIVIMWDEVKL